MDAILDPTLAPNIAYLLIAGGLILAALALAAPGTGVLEGLALIPLVLAGWLITQLPINAWALLVLLIGAILFFVSVRWPRNKAYLAASIAALVLGSAFLFRSQVWWVPAVNPILAFVVSLLSAGFFWTVALKAIEASQARPTHDLSSLVGAVGEASTKIHDEGSVQVASELWSARSEQSIPVGTRVRVVGRDGFTLIVEPIDHPEHKS